jgi:hypothetical protein
MEKRRIALSDIKDNIFLLWTDSINNKTIGLWIDSSKFSWIKEAPYQDLPRGVMVFIDRPDQSKPMPESFEPSFDFLNEVQARVDNRYNLQLRERGSKKDYQFYIRLYHQFDMYRMVKPGNQTE